MNETKYMCQQCGEEATVQGTQAIDYHESPFIAEYVVCEVCGYTIPRDTADSICLFKAVRDIAGLAQMQDVGDVAELHTALADIFERAMGAITIVEQD